MLTDQSEQADAAGVVRVDFIRRNRQIYNARVLCAPNSLSVQKLE
jgi:hypothetical protein